MASATRGEVADGEGTARGARAAGARGVEGDGALRPELGAQRLPRLERRAEPVHEQQRAALGAAHRHPDGEVTDVHGARVGVSS